MYTYAYNVIIGSKQTKGGFMKRANLKNDGSYTIEEVMTLSRFRREMFKWEKQANPGDKVLLTLNGKVVLTVTKGE